MDLEEVASSWENREVRNAYCEKLSQLCDEALADELRAIYTYCTEKGDFSFSEKLFAVFHFTYFFNMITITGKKLLPGNYGESETEAMSMHVLGEKFSLKRKEEPWKFLRMKNGRETL